MTPTFPPERQEILKEALKELGFSDYTRRYFSLPPIPPTDSGCKREVCLQHGRGLHDNLKTAKEK